MRREGWELLCRWIQQEWIRCGHARHYGYRKHSYCEAMLSSRGAAIITFKCAESAVCGLRPHGKVFFLSCGHSMRPASRRLLETALNEYQHEEVDHEVVGEVITDQ